LPLERTTRIALAVLLVLSHPLWAATIIVDESTCTLVDAITAANTDTATGGCLAGSSADTIELTADVTLTAPNNYYGGSDIGLPVVESEITLEGSGFTIERDPSAPPFLLFYVNSNGILALNEVTLRHGIAAYKGDAIFSRGTTSLRQSLVTSNGENPWVGVLYSTGWSNGSSLTLTDCSVSDNFGTGIEADGHNLTLTNTTVSGNWRGISVGSSFSYLTNVRVSGNTSFGISSTGFVFLEDSVVSDNDASGLTNVGGSMQVTNSSVSNNAGEGIYVLNGTVYLTNSTVSGNSGHGIDSYLYEGRITVTNSTVSGNLGAGISADLDTYGWLVVTNSTVSANNIAGIMTGWYEVPPPPVKNSIVAGNNGQNCILAGPDAVLIDQGSNFADDGTCGPGFADITPGVDFDSTLADNGGPTETHALFPGSVAIDAAGDCDLETDQRGFPRNDGACDSGSYEFQCSITVSKVAADALIWFTPDSSEFDVVTGYLSELLADTDFSRATCLGAYFASPAVDTLPEPPVGHGRYYLARGLTSCVGAHYGDSSLTPDPRDALAVGPCP
jgi:hypothetical protein